MLLEAEPPAAHGCDDLACEHDLEGIVPSGRMARIKIMAVSRLG